MKPPDIFTSVFIFTELSGKKWRAVNPFFLWLVFCKEILWGDSQNNFGITMQSNQDWGYRRSL